MATGLKVLSTEVWYGGGYCGICGDTQVIPNAVRYWDCDDGWKMGVLCSGCTVECKKRGPNPGDFAYVRGQEEVADHLDILAELGDLDGASSDSCST